MKKKKGFTLIELLAVIIILAIIALIATPIIMRVIERSKKGAAERSAENYIHAVETEAMSLRTEGIILDGTYGINSNGNLCPNNATTCNAAEEIKIDVKGTKPSSGSVVISNGKVVANGANNTTTSLTIGNYTATINESGSATATKGGGSSESVQSSGPNYYSLTSRGSISEGLPSDASTSVPSGQNVYLGFGSTDGETIDALYICFVRNSTEYCIKEGDTENIFSDNQKVLNDAFGELSCTLNESTSYSCSDDGLHASAQINSSVNAYLDRGTNCMTSSGIFMCF